MTVMKTKISATLH